MALCSRCLAIPFGILPDHPPVGSFYRLFDESELPSISCEYEQQQPLGYPWHTDLDSLAASVSACVLCATIHQGFQVWLSHFERGQKKQFYVEFQDTYDESVPSGERLWLTKRPSQSPGLSVLAKDPKKRRKFYVLAVVAFSVDASNPAAHVMQLRPPELDSGSVHSLNIAAEFLKACRDQHDGCHVEESPLPTRVLDTDLPDGMVKLIEPHGQSGKYACLSYCWGGVDNFITSQSTIDSRRSGFHVSELPKTLGDAVKTIRHLGIRYLWVDSLCICQDDPQDWAQESARMADVYSNAYLVIAANRSADASGGCFHSRTAQPSCEVDLPGYADNVHVRCVLLSDEIDWDHGGFTSEPLSKRAWGLQERALARRVLHFNSRQLYYECDNGIVSEDGSRQTRLHGNLPRPHQKIVQSDKENLHTLWYSLVWEYGERDLTYATDKLPAMSGLARVLSTRIGADYVAGIWSDALIDGLAWQSLDSGQPALQDPYVGPSWSWASYGGVAAIGHGRRSRYIDIATVLNWKLELKSEANPFGALSGASLQIRGPIVPLFASEDTDEDAVKRERAGLPPSVRGTTSDVEDAESSEYIFFDYEEVPRSGTWRNMSMKVLLLATLVAENGNDEDKDEETEPDPSVFGLVVIDAGAPTANEMQRIGWMFLPAKEADRIQEDEANWRTTNLI
ncbi:hypothetical protein PFICI_00396 [Pestalotiopsis fici W106-1]|uniref:Heterokaryon incompatibility domain-containing protein n=1 Tax=Pestalotiopsis fici (strain W106-1 / CGMCC3.15140) TaxID=1229662 RepID=W3XKI3_PESFW|nr:uncharacterized protein PFICI_00396 [Pestalotiopsis fici W106-1]ETS86568.1 hypothetical protein PFICI_00396 [Pestalotiopsis fici W106-1]